MALSAQGRLQEIKHKFRGAFFPDWSGVTQERFFEFCDNRLILSTPSIPVSDDEKEVATLVWERV
ncbi:MAG: lipocalin-like domain-containing protein [Oligoflexia bacterium]|nr:lipocalin-like domain-containing protein [Oligoflexia bacterium]